jgi:hypothetical protein
MSKKHKGEKPIKKDKNQDYDLFEQRKKKNVNTTKSKKMQEWEKLADSYYSQYES